MSKMIEMTNDTKRALDMITPIADLLGIEVRGADRYFLYLDDIAIGISCNSTWATVHEFIGYAFLMEFARRFRPCKITSTVENIIKRYWYSSEQVNQLKLDRGESNE